MEVRLLWWRATKKVKNWKSAPKQFSVELAVRIRRTNSVQMEGAGAQKGCISKMGET